MRSLKTVLPDFLSYHVTFYGAIHHSETLSRGPFLELESCCVLASAIVSNGRKPLGNTSCCRPSSPPVSSSLKIPLHHWRPWGSPILSRMLLELPIIVFCWAQASAKTTSFTLALCKLLKAVSETFQLGFRFLEHTACTPPLPKAIPTQGQGLTEGMHLAALRHKPPTFNRTCGLWFI